MNIIIIGAGMAGLIAANMLRRHKIKIVERNKSLPNNHTAVLRFRTTAVSDATGIPFRKQTVYKGLYDPQENRIRNEATVEDMNRYSMMVSGTLSERSILNLQPGQRYCAPRDFVHQAARNICIEFGQNVTPHDLNGGNNLDAIISTIPMPMMMKMFDYHTNEQFRSKCVWTIKGFLTNPISTVCQTLYQCRNPELWYRATLHDSEITLEFMFDPLQYGDKIHWCEHWCEKALECFGINRSSIMWETLPVVNKIPIGKIHPIDDAVRKRFMLWLTEQHKIYSLGRFATWRNILLDDIVHDVKRIEAMIEKGHTYEQR